MNAMARRSDFLIARGVGRSRGLILASFAAAAFGLGSSCIAQDGPPSGVIANQSSPTKSVEQLKAIVAKSEPVSDRDVVAIKGIFKAAKPAEYPDLVRELTALLDKDDRFKENEKKQFRALLLLRDTSSSIAERHLDEVDKQEELAEKIRIGQEKLRIAQEKKAKEDFLPLRATLKEHQKTLDGYLTVETTYKDAEAKLSKIREEIKARDEATQALNAAKAAQADAPKKLQAAEQDAKAKKTQADASKKPEDIEAAKAAEAARKSADQFAKADAKAQVDGATAKWAAVKPAGDKAAGEAPAAEGTLKTAKAAFEAISAARASLEAQINAEAAQLDELRKKAKIELAKVTVVVPKVASAAPVKLHLYYDYPYVKQQQQAEVITVTTDKDRGFTRVLSLDLPNVLTYFPKAKDPARTVKLDTAGTLTFKLDTAGAWSHTFEPPPPPANTGANTALSFRARAIATLFALQATSLIGATSDIPPTQGEGDRSTVQIAQAGQDNQATKGTQAPKQRRDITQDPLHDPTPNSAPAVNFDPLAHDLLLFPAVLAAEDMKATANKVYDRLGRVKDRKMTPKKWKFYVDQLQEQDMEYVVERSSGAMILATYSLVASEIYLEQLRVLEKSRETSPNASDAEIDRLRKLRDQQVVRCLYFMNISFVLAGQVVSGGPINLVNADDRLTTTRVVLTDLERIEDRIAEVRFDEVKALKTMKTTLADRDRTIGSLTDELKDYKGRLNSLETKVALLPKGGEGAPDQSAAPQPQAQVQPQWPYDYAQPQAQVQPQWPYDYAQPQPQYYHVQPQATCAPVQTKARRHGLFRR